METLHPLLDIRDLEITFQKGKQSIHAVAGVNVQLQKGTTLGIVGESGSGKSTLARAVVQLVPVTSGSIAFDGVDLSTLPARKLRQLRKELQMVFQDPGGSLNEYMRVGQIITEPLLVHGVARRDELKARAKRLLVQVGLQEEDAQRYPQEFSGGQKQRIAIARAISIEPKLLVCDEPTSALDVSVQAKVLNLLSDLRDSLDLTILFIAHDIAVVHHFCDEVAVMSNGKIIEHGSVDDVVHNPKHEITRELIASSV
ncbi:MAG: ABC transporter ATP-binding protein [Phycisphaerae bacterium]|jgi:peptide/nickel transport system ATP-binding protein|nr:ABC transporter ATP-binding protein [Phycisphaerae bacterium]|tara:strand:- start:2500 stop:3267 length:768 start_codon:yes stop_codon:yes gene_type:complete